MDSETHKNLISRIRQSDLDEEEQEEAISLVKQERKEELPSATVSVSGDEDRMGGTAKLTLGDVMGVTVHFSDLDIPDDYDPEEDEISETVYLSLDRINGMDPTGAGDGGAPGSDESILADFHLTYGQGKQLLRLVDDEVRIGTPGDVENAIRRLLGPPEDVNPLLRDIQENGVRGWRRVE